jgi:hypothetical protein
MNSCQNRDMSAKPVTSCIWGLIGGAVVGVVLFFIINNFVVINRPGWLRPLGWPWSEFYLWGLAGGILGATGSLVTWRRGSVHAREVAEAAQIMGFEYYPSASRADFGEAGQLPLFSKWYSAAHGLAGKRDGMPIQMVDYTYIEKGDEDSSCYSQTVVLVAGTDQLPAFELRPRHLGIRMLGMLGLEGIIFDPAQGDRDSAPGIEKFNRDYHLSLGLDNELKKLALQVKDLEAAEVTARAEEKVRQLFSLEVLYFFAERPGWYVESNGKHLAIWRRKNIVRGAERPMFLAEALEVRNRLVDTRTRLRSTILPAVKGSTDSLMAPARLGGTILGLFIGFFCIIFTQFIFFDDPFLGFVIIGPVLGAFLGHSFLTRPVLWWIRRRQARQRQAVAESPWEQPPGSTAQVRDNGDQLIIVFPAPGLLRGMGSFFFIWCCLWNLFIGVFTAFWLPAAGRGEITWEGGNQAVSPLVASLFLIPFWLVGIVTIVVLLHRGRRWAILVVDNDHVRFEEKTMFGSERREWRHQELADVQASPRSESPFSQEMDLCLTPVQGDIVRLLGWRPSKEIKWLAHLIREKC